MMSRGACDACRTNKRRCNQEQPICQQCLFSSRKCSYVYSKNIKRSCTSCRLKKRGCDTLRPTCTRCKTTGVSCNYDDITNPTPNLKPVDTKPALIIKLTKISLFQYKKLALKPQLNFMEYDYENFQLIYNGKRATRVVPTAFIKDLFLPFYFNKIQIDGKSLPTQVYTISKSKESRAFLKYSLLNHLVQIFFTRINTHFPIAPEYYFTRLLRVQPNQPATHILLFAICIASLTLFPRTPVCIQLRQFYYNAFLNSLKLQYNRPTMPLILSYIIMGAIATPDLCHEQVKSPIFYLNQIMIHLPLLGLHMKIPTKFSIPDPSFRNSLIFTLQYTHVLIANSILNYPRISYIHDTKFSHRPLLFSRLHKPPSTPTFRIQTIEDCFSYFLFIDRVIKITFKLATKQTRVKRVPGEAKQISQAEIPSYVLEAEMSLHSAFFGTKFVKDGSLLKDKSLQVPTDCKSIHNFISVVNQLLDFYRPVTEFSVLATISPQTKPRILIQDFLTWAPEMKVITMIYMIKHALSRHSVYYVNSGLPVRWWRIYSIMLFVNRLQEYIQSHAAIPQTSELINQTASCLINLLKLGRERSEAPRFILDTLDSMKKNTTTHISLPPRLSL